VKPKATTCPGGRGKLKTTAAIPNKVYVVVDREFGERLAAIEPGAPVWIVNTPTNKAVAQRLWKERPQDNHLTGITTFDSNDSSSPDDILLGELNTIDLHHGSYSADPPYTLLEVIGTPLSATIENEMSAYGFNEFESNSAGFTAKRPAASN
jgi:hypothetical protein